MKTTSGDVPKKGNAFDLRLESSPSWIEAGRAKLRSRGPNDKSSQKLGRGTISGR